MATIDSTDDAQLDVRDVDDEPFTVITETLNDLEDGDTLLLINSFEPVPLYDVLDDRGFTYDATEVAEDEWHIEIERIS